MYSICNILLKIVSRRVVNTQGLIRENTQGWEGGVTLMEERLVFLTYDVTWLSRGPAIYLVIRRMRLFKNTVSSTGISHCRLPLLSISDCIHPPYRACLASQQAVCPLEMIV